MSKNHKRMEARKQGKKHDKKRKIWIKCEYARMRELCGVRKGLDERIDERPTMVRTCGKDGEG